MGTGDDGATALANCRGLGSLWALFLEGNPITDVAANALADSPHFPNLVSVYYGNTLLTTAGIAALRAMLTEKEKKRPEWTNAPDEPA